jgi:hypothetical protein
MTVIKLAETKMYIIKLTKLFHLAVRQYYRFSIMYIMNDNEVSNNLRSIKRLNFVLIGRRRNKSQNMEI